MKKANSGKKQKTNHEIRALVEKANLDFEIIINKALNDYLPKIFHSCPFTDDICFETQCIDCSIAQNIATP